jgi:outer membrane protein insertion porin family
VTGDSLGAQAYAIGTAQLTFPNFLPEALDIDTSLFTDVGTVGLVDQEALYLAQGRRPEDELALRATAGLSVYWQSPFGPVRIDLSQVLQSESYDREEVFRFSAGTRF